MFGSTPRSVLRLSVCLLLLCAGAAQAKPLASSQFENCGLQTQPPQDCPECQGEAVFEVEGQWHGLAQCSRDLRDAWARFGPDQRLDLPGQPQLADLARDQILSEMAAPDVRFVATGDGGLLDFATAFGPDLRPRIPLSGVVLINERGEAYNGMGQTGMAYFLLQFAVSAERGGYAQAETDAALYRLLGRAALASVLMPVAEGGLTTSTNCALAPELRCSWYHSITRDDRAGAAGGTLNQMLHVLRDMTLIDRLATQQGWALDLDLDGAVEAGLNQLFLSGGYQGPGTGPDLADFNSRGRDSTGPAWAYYGFSTQSKAGKGGYFLKNRERNCSYHVHDVQLLEVILKRAAAADIAREARQAAAADDSALTSFRAVLLDVTTARDLPEEIVCTPVTQGRIARLLRQDGN